MADLTEQVGNQILRLGGNFIRSTAELIEELLKILEKNKMDDPNKYTIAKHIANGGQVYTSNVRDDFVADMKRHLTEQGVAFTFMDINDGDNCKILVIRDIDKKRAEFATKLVMAEHGQMSEFEKDEFINFTPRSELACVCGLGYHEYELFREKAKDNGLKFAATVNKNNTITILYNVNDKAELDMSMKQMSWNMNGRNGDEYQAAYHTKAESIEYMKTLYKKKAQPMYIVDARHPNKILKVDKEELFMCSQYDDNLSKETNFENAEIKVSIRDSKYVPQLNEMLVKFEEPVLITEKEFRDRNNVIKRKLPKIDKEWEMKEEPYRTLFDEKVTSENEYKMGEKSVLDNDFSFTGFVENDVNYEDTTKLEMTELEEIDLHVKQSVAQVTRYEYYQPSDKHLLKHIEEVKKQRAIDKAKVEVERKQEKSDAKEARTANKNKNEER